MNIHHHHHHHNHQSIPFQSNQTRPQTHQIAYELCSQITVTPFTGILTKKICNQNFLIIIFPFHSRHTFFLRLTGLCHACDVCASVCIMVPLVVNLRSRFVCLFTVEHYFAFENINLWWWWFVYRYTSLPIECWPDDVMIRGLNRLPCWWVLIRPAVEDFQQQNKDKQILMPKRTSTLIDWDVREYVCDLFAWLWLPFYLFLSLCLDIFGTVREKMSMRFWLARKFWSRNSEAAIKDFSLYPWWSVNCSGKILFHCIDLSARTKKSTE